MEKTCDNCSYSNQNNPLKQGCGTYRLNIGKYKGDCYNKSEWVPIKNTKEKEMKPKKKITKACTTCHFNYNSGGIGTSCVKRRAELGVPYKQCSHYEEWVERYKFKTKSSSPIDKYNFKGSPELCIICSEALKEEKHGFVLVGKENAVIGLLRGLYVEDFNGQPGITCVNDSFKGSKTGHKTLPYLFKVVEKKEAHVWLKVIQEATKAKEKELHKIKRNIRKERTKRNKTGAKTNHYTVLTA